MEKLTYKCLYQEVYFYLNSKAILVVNSCKVSIGFNRKFFKINRKGGVVFDSV